MDAHLLNNNEAPLRHADIVMAPERLGAMHQTRISFARTLIRKMARQQWQVSKQQWALSPDGYGHVIYQLKTPEQHYHLVVFCDQIGDNERNDRVIAEKWDVTFALVSGAVDKALMERLTANVPRQEAGRNSNNVLVLARANKSVRVFNHIVTMLAQGKQPSLKELANVGYILRTTAVYGNGKFGIADFKLLENNPDFNQSFSAQMCAVYLLRQFSLDWIEYLALQQGGEHAVKLDRELQRYIGVGNATGLGMAPYLINHPCIVDRWMTTREKALSAVLRCSIDALKIQQLQRLLNKAIQHLTEVVTSNSHQKSLNTIAANELSRITSNFQQELEAQTNWKQFVESHSDISHEAQEVLLSCLMELYPSLVDQYQEQMNCSEILTLPSGKTVQDLLAILDRRYAWATNINFTDRENRYWFWYRSEDKEEPRLGVRGEDTGEDRELPLDIARQVCQLAKALNHEDPATSMAEFLLKYPQFRAIARRIWTLGNKVMGDIQLNVLGKKFLPIHLLRCKLSMFGATKFDPRSDRWVQVTFFQGAPLVDELHEDEWIFPLLPTLTERNGDNCDDRIS